LKQLLLIANFLLAALAYRALWFWHPGRAIASRSEGWFFLPSNTSPQIVFALAALLLVRRWPTTDAAEATAGAATAALPLALAGSILFGWSCYTNAEDILVLSLALMAAAGILSAFGWRVSRETSLPLVVLLFAIPLPAVLTNEFFYILQHWTARGAAALLSFADFSVLRVGTAIYTARTPFLVIDTCSGLRFIEVLGLLGVIYAGWDRTCKLRTALRIAAALPIAFLFNLLRVCLLILYPSSEFSATHTFQGWAVFFAAVITLGYLDRLVLARLPWCRRQSHLTPTLHLPQRALSAASARWLPAHTAALSLLLALSIWLPPFEYPLKAPAPPIELPLDLDGWRMGSRIELDRQFLSTVRYSTYAYRLYRRGGRTAAVFVGEDDRENRSRSFFTRKNELPRAGLEIEKRRVRRIDGVAPQVVEVLAASSAEQILSLSWYSNTLGLAGETLRALLALDQSAWRRPQPGRVVRVSAEVPRDSEGRAQTEAVLEALAVQLLQAVSAPPAPPSGTAVGRSREPQEPGA
jgi:exosortase